MAFMEGFKKFMGMSPLDDGIDDDDDDREDTVDVKEVPIRGFGYSGDMDKMSKLDELDGIDGFGATTNYSTGAGLGAFSREESAKVVNIHPSSPQTQVVLVKPEKFEEASSIADHLMAKRTVIVNTEVVNPDVRRRLIDFLSGVAYSENGTVKMASNTTFVITPNTVGVMGSPNEEEPEHDTVNNGGYQY